MNLKEKTEVTKEQYMLIKNELPGVCFQKEENGKYFIKIAYTKYQKHVEQIIQK